MNSFSKAIFLIGSISLSAGGVHEPVFGDQPADRPNFILIMADDLGWGDTSFNGHRILKTPNLDAMASNGLRFNRFYSAAPVCSPTRGSCLTGRHPFRYGIFHANVGHLKKQEFTLAEYLKSIGYRTGHFGKWHLGTLTRTVRDSNRGGKANPQHFSPPDQHGFDHYFSTEAKVPTFDPLVKPANAKKTFWFPVGPKDETVAYGTRYWKNGVEVKAELKGDDSQIIMDQAIEFISKPTDQPFLGVVWFHAPHLPVVASEEDRLPFKHLDGYSQSYFGCIRALDRQVGRLRKKLRDLGIADDTVVFFCSDNGPEGNQTAPGSAKKLRGRKRSLYEGGVRVPGLVEWPKKIPAGSVTDFPAVTSDYLPTIARITNGDLPGTVPLDGVSLVPLFKNPRQTNRSKPIYFESGKQVTMIQNHLKLVGKTSKSKSKITVLELFDLQKDPAESQNLKMKRLDTVKEMEAKLVFWRESCQQSRNGKDYAK